ncbi:MAG: DNA polymerase-3 subunit epsilon [Cellvibrionaceae bacterium]|jgi:DNA polymerase-3 subunit epsilon
MRQIVLDTETTGLEPSKGHRVIEIGCVELVNRKLTGKHYHQYLQPERDIEEQAIEIHGITNAFLKDKPVFSRIVDEFMAFVDGAQLIIHNAPFDVGFINNELKLFKGKYSAITDYCSIIDTLAMAREKHPGQKNNLDALCKRYTVDNSQRDLHGALLDSEILADVYLMMTGGQTALLLSDKDDNFGNSQLGENEGVRRLTSTFNTPTIRASDDEVTAHLDKLATIDKKSAGQCLWLQQGKE